MFRFYAHLYPCKMAPSAPQVHELCSDLKFLAKIREGEKLYVSTKSLQVAKSWWTILSRMLTGESSRTTIGYIRDKVDRALEYCDQLAMELATLPPPGTPPRHGSPLMAPLGTPLSRLASATLTPTATPAPSHQQHTHPARADKRDLFNMLREDLGNCIVQGKKTGLEALLHTYTIAANSKTMADLEVIIRNIRMKLHKYTGQHGPVPALDQVIEDAGEGSAGSA